MFYDEQKYLDGTVVDFLLVNILLGQKVVCMSTMHRIVLGVCIILLLLLDYFLYNRKFPKILLNEVSFTFIDPR